MFLLWIISTLLWISGPSECSPVRDTVVDMTYTFDENTLHWPTLEDFEFKITVNETTEEGYWLQLDEYSSPVHLGTHMDAPCHFVPGRWCADEIPIERLDGPAAVVDITAKTEANPDATVDVEDLEQWESLSGQSLDGTIVVIRSGWGKKWGNKEEFIGTAENDDSKMHFPGMSPEAARWLVDNRDIHGVISETLSLDHGQSKDFMAHRILLDKNIYGLESVANVDAIPVVGAHIYVRPMKIGKGSGAPTRIVAWYKK